MTNVMLFFSQSFLRNSIFLTNKIKNNISEYVFVITSFTIYYIFSVLLEFKSLLKIKKTTKKNNNIEC